MKFIIIGLGNFGAALGLRLVEDGHEVIGVDKHHSPVDLFQDKLTHTIVLDTTDEVSIKKLPLSDTDVVVISIGEDIGASVTTTALIKKNCSTALIISRAISNVHHTILEAMGVERIIHPEADFADQLANQLSLDGALKTLVLDNRFEIIQVQLPSQLQGKSVEEADLRKQFDVSIITILKKRERRNILGRKTYFNEVAGVVGPDTIFEKDDLLVLFGQNSSLKKMLRELE